MKYSVNPFHGFAQRIVFADIHVMEIHSSAYFREVLLMTREQIVHHNHSFSTARHQTTHQSRSYESRAARYQKSAHCFQCAIPRAALHNHLAGPRNIA